MKQCRKCDVVLVRGENWTEGMAKNWYYMCRPCKNSKELKYRKENKEAIAEYKREYHREYLKTPEGRAKKNAAEQAREARKLAQTPWMSRAEYAEVEAMYLYNAVMPGTWHVDHIKPLSKGGLHHPSNLQLMRGEENVRKNARWDCCDKAKAAESAIQGKLSLLLYNAQRFTQLPLVRCA